MGRSYDLGHGRKPLSLKDRRGKFPLTMGHEIVGEVIALGPDAEGAKIGHQCLVYPWIGCGACRTVPLFETHVLQNPAGMATR